MLEIYCFSLSFLAMISLACCLRIPKELNQLDPDLFEFTKLDVLMFEKELLDSDEKMEEIRILFQNSRFFISFKSRCDGRELKVIKEIENTTQDSRKFYKNPCETILMINDKVPDFIPNQPYFFAVESDTIIEIQSLSFF